MPTDQIDNELRQLYASYPGDLFKYRSAHDADTMHHLEALVVRGEIFFANPQSFNDPFDLAVDPSFDAPTDVQAAYWNQDLRDRQPELGEAERQAQVSATLAYSSGEGGPDDMRDKHRAIARRHSVFCACDNPVSTLMWAYYANGHQGVAVRLRLDKPAVSLMRPVQLYPVAYSKDWPQPNFFTEGLVAYMRGIFGTKSTEWQHEREWRFIRDAAPSVVALPRSMVNGVVFGVKTPDALKARVSAWASQRGHDEPLELLQVVQGGGSFELTLEAL